MAFSFDGGMKVIKKRKMTGQKYDAKMYKLFSFPSEFERTKIN